MTGLHITRGVFFFRIRGYGLWVASYKTHPPLFSERHGRRRTFPPYNERTWRRRMFPLFGWRAEVLRPDGNAGR